MKTVPFAHQQECFEIIKDKDYWGVFLEPGLGKTKLMLDTLTYNKETQGATWHGALVVCPNTLVENWIDEVVKHSNLSAIAMTGSRSSRLNKLSHEADIHIINYESARVLYKELKAKGFGFLILDESVAVKNFKSLQARACYDISTVIPRRYILSGAPIMNSPLDIFSQFRVLNPTIFGVSFYRFRGRYAVMGGFMNKQAIQWRDMEDFKRRVFSCATRKTKDECLDLPDKLYQVVKVDLTDEQRSVYKALKEDFIYEFKDVTVTAPIMLTRLMRFSQITSGFTKDVEGVEHAFATNPKIDWLIEFLDNLNHDRKVVIFCRFRHEIKVLEEAFRRARITYISVHGDTDERIDKVKQFNSDTHTRCFIGQSQTTGIGINLTSASYCVFFTNSYSYGDRIQCEDRLHRIGQVANVTYIDLLARNTVDEGIHRALRKKENLASMVLGDIIKML